MKHITYLLYSAPSEPLDLTAVEITNSTITLSWKPPKVKNGVIKYYKVVYNHKDVSVNTRPFDGNNNANHSDPIFYKLVKLLRYHNYTISVLACTTECSKRSEQLAVRTKIGCKY